MLLVVVVTVVFGPVRAVGGWRRGSGSEGGLGLQREDVPRARVERGRLQG